MFKDFTITGVFSGICLVGVIWGLDSAYRNWTDHVSFAGSNTMTNILLGCIGFMIYINSRKDK